jgi:hypothetical protein
MNAPKIQTAWHEALDSATDGHEVEWRDVALDMLEHARALETRLTLLIQAYDRTQNCMSPEGYTEMSHELLTEVEDNRHFLGMPNVKDEGDV